MKKTLALTVLGAALLSSCSVIGTKSAAVSGQVTGFQAAQDLRLALVGYNNGTYVADGRQAQLLEKFLTGGYVLTLPRDVPYGTYRVVVFRDMNSNNTYDTGDVVLSKLSEKVLVYTGRDNAPFNGVKFGWNIYNTQTGAVQTTSLTNLDIAAAN